MKDSRDELHGKFSFQDRKETKRERKYLSQKDRSKYKKTDLTQEVPKKMPQGFRRGHVTSIQGNQIHVKVDGELLLSSLRGTLKQEKGLEKNLVTIGDFVWLDKENQIAHVESRYSYLARRDNLRHRKKQILAANVDQVLICSSVTDPPLKVSLIDRYIIAALKGNMEPVIVINKIDLLKDHSFVDTLVSLYSSLNIPVFLVSAYTKEGIDALKVQMGGKTSVFSGQSGVGKTSLLNLISQTERKVLPVGIKTKKGTHTTSYAELIFIDNDGFCVDTPGIRSFSLSDVKVEELLNYFSDLQAYASSCKYPNCTHIHEPDCAVKQKVEEGKISRIRYESYVTIREGHDKDYKDLWE